MNYFLYIFYMFLYIYIFNQIYSETIYSYRLVSYSVSVCTPQRILTEGGLAASPGSRYWKWSTDEKTKGLLCGQLVFFLWGWHKRSLVLCLHEEKNSSLLLIVAPSGLNIMKKISVRHSRHVLLTGLKLDSFASCLNLIEYLICLSFSFQICLERQVAVLFAFVSILKLVLWAQGIKFKISGEYQHIWSSLKHYHNSSA